MDKTKISLKYCAAYKQEILDEVICKVLEPFNLPSIIIPGSKVLIKPNLLGNYKPAQAITTHPSVLEALIKILKELDADIYLGDSPGNSLIGIKNIWETTQVAGLEKKYNVKLVNFEACGLREFKTNIPNIKSIHLSKILFDVDYIINVPKLKTHTLTGFSCGVKNLYGCVPGARKAEYHKLAPKKENFVLVLNEIYNILKDKICITLVDGIEGLEGNGPGINGEKRNYNGIFASTDAAVLDEFILSLIDKNKTKENFNKVEFIGDDLNKFNFDNVKLPSTKLLYALPPVMTKLLIKCLGGFVWIKPYIDNKKCKRCAQCVKACPAKAVKIDKNKNLFVDVKKCISCFCCHELCENKSIEIKTSLLAKLFY